MNPRYMVGALPYRLAVKKPLTVSKNNKPYRLMTDRDYSTEAGCSDFRAFMLKFLRDRSKFSKYDSDAMGMVIPGEAIDDTVDGELRFVIKSGKYGYESELWDVDTDEVKIRTPKDCELIPLVCRAVFRKSRQYCLLVFEKFGNASCISVFFKTFLEYIRQEFKDSDYSIDYGCVTNTEHVKNALSQVRAIHLIKRRLGRDVAEHLDYDEDSEEEVKVDIRISASRGRFLKLDKKLGLAAQNNEFDGILKENSCDEINLELKSGNRSQMLYSSRDFFQIPFDVTDLVQSDATGHPTVASFCSACQECVNLSAEKIWRS